MMAGGRIVVLTMQVDGLARFFAGGGVSECQFSTLRSPRRWVSAQALAPPASVWFCRSAVSVEGLSAGHELSIRGAGFDGAVCGEPPRWKISTRSMRPPQQGQGFADIAGASASLPGSGTGAGGT